MLSETITKRGLGKPPCYKCTEREPGCHGKCERYQEWSAKCKAAKAEEMDARLREKGAQGFLADNTVARKARWRRAIKK